MRKGFIPLEVSFAPSVRVRRTSARLLLTGFTLIELLIYVAVFSLLTALVFRFSLTLIDVTSKTSAKEEVAVNASKILKTFDSELRGARDIYDPTSDFLGNPGQLSIITNRNLPPDEDETYIDIYLDNGRFCTKHELEGVICHTSEKIDVTSLDFEKIIQAPGIEAVRMNATLNFASPRVEYQNEETVRASVRLRNY